MATYRTTLITRSPDEVVFDYLARFSSAVEWDPGVVASKDLDPTRVGVGSAYELTVRSMGKDVAYRYEIEAYDRPHSVALRGESARFATDDVISIASDGNATRVTYEAVLEAKGLGRLLTPVLPFVFTRICRRAVEGLQREIDRLGAPPTPGVSGPNGRSAHEPGQTGSRPA